MAENQVIFIDASKSVADAVRIMMDKEVWSLVVTKSGVPVGVLTERDAIRRCYAKGYNPDITNAESIMSSPLITVDPEVPLGQAMMLMFEKNIRRVYVVEGGKITGRITQNGAFGRMLDILTALSSAV